MVFILHSRELKTWTLKFLFLEGKQNCPITVALYDMWRKPRVTLKKNFFLRSIGRRKKEKESKEQEFVFYPLFPSKGSYDCRSL